MAMQPDNPRTNPAGAAAPAVDTAAVIDIGTNSIRMAIAEIDRAGGVRILDKVFQEVDLGKDTFTRGHIRKSTIEACVRILKSYRRLIEEYRVTNEEQVRVVATSAVREARNRVAFLDRIAIATGLQVEMLDEAEVNRINYLGIQPLLAAEPSLAAAKTIVAEVGGGNTELLVLQAGNVVYSHTYRLGSLRLRETLDAFRAPTTKVRHIMESQIRLIVSQVVQHVGHDGPIEMIALGGDVRFAASQLVTDWNPDEMTRVPLPALQQFTDEMLAASPDKLVQEYRLSYPDAETLAPALLAYAEMARAFDLKSIVITNVNLRSGLLKQMAARGTFSEEFRAQILRSARDFGRKFDYDAAHAGHVSDLARKLFLALQDEHQLGRQYELPLYLAGLLHEVGTYISTNNAHHHSMYLIAHSDLFGLSRHDIRLIALTARYGGGTAPKPRHRRFGLLDRRQRIAVSKMAALLRVADALDASRSQRVADLDCAREPGKLVITVSNVDDLAVEQLALDQKGSLFEDVFGLQVLLRTVRPSLR